jgi:predicted RNA methylase
VARHHKVDVIGSVKGSDGVIVATSIPGDMEGFFGALGVSTRRLMTAENAVDTAQKDVVNDLWNRAGERIGLGHEALHPRLLGLNLAGKDVFARTFGRTFTDGNRSHADWEKHPRDGQRKDENGRAPLFLRARDSDDWALLARTAVGTTARFGRISQREIDDLRSLANDDPSQTPSPEEFRELIEQELTRSVVRGYVKSKDEFINTSVGFPALGERTGTRLTMAQFSTPPVVGWLAARFVGADAESILEPTAGNGVLVAAAAAQGSHIVGGELDTARAKRALTGLEGRAEIIEGDFTASSDDRFNQKFDGVIGNPPFGSLATSQTVLLSGFGGRDTFKAKTLDAQILAMSIDKLKAGGNAVLVMPAELYEPSAIQGHRKQQDILLRRAFEDVETVALDAKLYRSMGANAPVLIHFLQGRKQELSPLEEAVSKSVDTVSVMTSFEDLVSWAEERFDLSDYSVDGVAAPAPKTTSSPTPDEAPEENEPRETSSGPAVNSGGEVSPSPNGPRSPDADTPNPADDPEPADGPEPPVSEPAPSEPPNSTEQDQPADDLVAVEWYDETIEEDQFTSPYVPFSKVGQGSVVIQRSLQGPVYRALQAVEQEVGDIDEYVASRMGVELETLLEGKILSPEQVDSIALGMYRRSQGDAMIIGDKMGVGKGRQLAAQALSALNEGQPVFFATLDPNLFTDFASRDLRDVSGETLDSMIDRDFVRPFIFNPTPEAYLRDPDTGREIYATTASERNAAKESCRINANSNMVMLTYSQLQTQSGHWRLQSVLNWLDANRGKQPLLLLDEVHKAAGVDSRTGAWMQSIIDRTMDVGGSVVYSSATSMKSGKNIVVYSAALPDTGISTRELTNLMEQNPLSMQEVLSAEMASGGRLIEREMSSAGIEREMVQLADLSESKMEYARKATDTASDFLAELVDIAPEMRDAANALAKAMYGGLVLNGQDKTVDVTTTSPVSQFDNYSRYLMLAVKGMFAEDLLLRSIAKGEKPTMVVDSTADTMVGWVAAHLGKADGEIERHPHLGHVLKRNAHRLLDVKIETAMGDSEVFRLEQFNGWLEDFYDRVDSFDWSRMRLNVLDVIGEVCEAHGLTYKDITRRSLTVKERDGRFFVEKREPVSKQDAIREYGSGITDVLGLNRGAATGLSAHASPVIGPDVRRRSMIPIQFQKDIADQRQVEGRINRFAQISAPIYYTPSTGFAADERLSNLFNRANRNLTSSTSASRENSTNIEGIDLLNPVGDMAVATWAKNNPEIALRMDIDEKGIDLGRKLLGRIVCLNLDLQEAVLSDIDTIFSLHMERLTREGRNPLKLSRFDWKGEVETLNVLVDGTEGASSMSQRPVLLNKVRFTEHVRWETTKNAVERVEERHKEEPDRATPHIAYGFDRIRSRNTQTGYNFAHEVFAEARHGGGATSEHFRNIDPVLADRLLFAYQRTKAPGADDNRTRTDIAAEFFFSRIKYETEREPDSQIAKAWTLILDGEHASKQKFRPGRYMVPLDRAAERAKFFADYGTLLETGKLVGIRESAINDYMQGEFGKAYRSVGIEDGIIPAVITSTRSPKDGLGNFSDWNVSFLTAGSKGYFSASLSSMRSGLNLSENFVEGQSPIVSFSDMRDWMARNPKSPEAFSKVYGDRWNAVWREMIEAIQECGYEENGFNIRSGAGHRAFTAINDNIPAGAKIRERFVLEGNLFAALSLVQSGKKAQGEKAIFTDAQGINRHAIVLSEKNTDALLLNLNRRSQHTGLPTKALSTDNKLQAYLGMVSAVMQLGSDNYMNEDIKEILLQRFSDGLQILDKSLWLSLREELQSEPATVARRFADEIGNASEDMPVSVSVGADIWRANFDAGSRVKRSRSKSEAVAIFPAHVEVRDPHRYDYGPYRVDYSVQLGMMKPGLDSIDISTVAGIATSASSFSIIYRKTNPTIKNDPRYADLIAKSIDRLDGVKLASGLLAREFDLTVEQDIALAADILSSFAKNHQNEVVLSGGGKRIFKALEKMSVDIARNEHGTTMDIDDPDRKLDTDVEFSPSTHASEVSP